MSKKRLRSESDEELEQIPPKRARATLSWRVPRDLDLQTDRCAVLLNALKKCKGSESKQGDFLMRVPSKRVCPGYYDIVAQPIDLMKIQHKVVTDDYTSISSFLSDVGLLFSNTRLFYAASSEEHKHVDVLETDFTQILAQQGIDAGSASRSRSGSLNSPTHLTLRIPKTHFQFTPPVAARRRSVSNESGSKESQASRPEKKGSTKPENKGLSKAESKGLSKTESKGLSKTESKGLSKPESKGLTRLEKKGLSKTDSKASSKTESKVSTRLDKALSKVESKGSGKTESKGLSKTEVKGLNKPESKGLAKQESKPSSGRGKVAKQQALMQEYLTSDDPVKVFLAAVYTHRELGSGEYTAEPFLLLPSRTLYPEYYKVITQPMDLSTICKKTEAGKYPNLKAIQDDMIIMIKNAHHFNEPGSEIYKLASSLRKIIILRCSELERKYQTVTKTMPPKAPAMTPTGDAAEGKKVPKLKISISESSRGHKTSMSSDDGHLDCRSSDDDWSSDDEGEGDVNSNTPVKLLLRIKKDKLGGASVATATEDHLEKLLHSRKPPLLKRQLMAVYHRIAGKIDSDRRLLSELFMRRPSSKLYPEYYMVIKDPVDMREILGRIRSGGFSDLRGLEVALELMVNNALTFNEEGSQVYCDALVLLEVGKTAIAQLRENWDVPRPVPRPVPPPVTPTQPALRGRPKKIVTAMPPSLLAPNDVTALFGAVKSFTDHSGRHLWLTFKQLPTGVSSDYYSVVKRPIDMTIVENKRVSGLYTNPEQIFDDLSLMMDNAFTFFSRDSRQSQDAIALHRVSVRKYMDLKAAAAQGGKSPVVPDVKEHVQKLLCTILTQAMSSKSAKHLRGVVATKEVEVQTEGVVRYSFNLENVEKWVEAGEYRRLDLLQGDVVAILKSASREGRRVLARDLGAGFLAARDKACGQGRNQLWSPALLYKAQKLESDLDQAFNSRSITPSSPSPVPAVVGSPDSARSRSDSASPKPIPGGSAAHASAGMERMEWEGPAERIGESDSCEFEDVSYAVGEIVHVQPSDPSTQTQPHIVMIEKFWKDNSSFMCFDGVWFYRPEETFHHATKKFYEKEVFKSDFHGVARMTQVLGKCSVMFVRDYPRLFPQGFAEEDVYVCESRYSYKTKAFKRIKNWTTPGTPPTLLYRATPLSSINRVPSIFATHVTKQEKTTPPPKSKGPLDVSYVGLSMKQSTTTVMNPEPSCIYYEQYWIDEDYFRLGDYVYLRSDQENPFIARIDRIWTDKNGDPWIHGPWFVRPKEVHHTPTRTFYRQELLLSNIHDSNPMRSISGKCVVIPLLDYCRKRPTGYPEKDVYVLQSRYNEAEKEIKRVKGLKHPWISPAVVTDEIFHFAQDIQLTKVPSPRLFTSEFNPVAVPALPSLATGQPATAGAATLALGGKLGGSSSGGITIPLGGKTGGLNVTPQLLQQLLASASKLATTRPVIIPLPTSLSNSATPTGHTLLSQSSAKLPVPSPSPSPTPSASGSSQFPCQWLGCSKNFKGPVELYNHVVGPGPSHLSKEVEGSFFCRWRYCPRNPISGGRSFDSMNKISRHMREVHLMKLSTLFGIGSRILPRPPTASPLATTPSELFTTSLPVLATPTTTTTTTTSMVTVPATPPKTTASIFLPPPENRQKVVHSDIYRRYIQGVRSNSQHLGTNADSATLRAANMATPPEAPRASDWFGPEATKNLECGTTKPTPSAVTDALWALRDHMIKDSTLVKRYLDKFL